MNAAMLNEVKWQPVCSVDDLVAGSGVAVLLGQQPVALFWLPELEPGLFALAHRDPFSGAEVLAHGLICDINGELTVASPLYKQHFRLTDGVCLEDAGVSVACWPVRINGDQIEIMG